MTVRIHLLAIFANPGIGLLSISLGSVTNHVVNITSNVINWQSWLLVNLLLLTLYPVSRPFWCCLGGGCQVMCNVLFSLITALMSIGAAEGTENMTKSALVSYSRLDLGYIDIFSPET